MIVILVDFTHIIQGYIYHTITGAIDIWITALVIAPVSVN